MPEENERKDNLDKNDPAAAGKSAEKSAGKSAEEIKAAVQMAAARRAAEQGASARLADKRAAEALVAGERRAAKREAAANRAAAHRAAKAETAANRAFAQRMNAASSKKINRPMPNADAPGIPDGGDLYGDAAGNRSAGGPAKRKSANSGIDDNLKGCAIPVGIFLALSIITFYVWKYSPGFSFESFPGFNRYAEPAAEAGQPQEATTSKSSEDKSFWDALFNSDKKPEETEGTENPGGQVQAADASAQGQEADGSGQGQETDGSGQGQIAETGAERQAADAGLQSETDSDALLAEYAKLLLKHDVLAAAADRFIAGDIEPDEFRGICAEINNYLNDAVDRLNFIKDSDGTRKNILMAAVLSDQIASASILKIPDGGIAGELLDPASNYSRNAADAREAYAAFADLYR